MTDPAASLAGTGSGIAHTHFPAARAEGFADMFPTFRDGHVENVLGDAVALSNRERRWVDVTVEVPA